MVASAHPSFLAIYNPALGPSEETQHQQIVFYSTAAEPHQYDTNPVSGSNQDKSQEQQEQLRQIGLAQGMIDFAK